MPGNGAFTGGGNSEPFTHSLNTRSKEILKINISKIAFTCLTQFSKDRRESVLSLPGQRCQTKMIKVPEGTRLLTC